MYSSYTAASFARKHDLAGKHGVNLEGALTWAFEFEDQPYFAGFRALATNGVDLPVLNVFRMFGKMSGRAGGRRRARAPSPLEAILQDGVRGEAGRRRAGQPRRRRSSASWSGTTTTTTCPGPTPPSSWRCSGLPVAAGEARLTHYRDRRGPQQRLRAWKRMGSPIAPNAEQYAQLEAAGQLARMDAPATLRVERPGRRLNFDLPRQARLPGRSLLDR